MVTETVRFYRRLSAALMLAVLALSVAVPTGVAAQASTAVYRVVLSGVLSDYHVGYAERVIREAERTRAAVVVVELETSGASLRAAAALAQRIAQADVPVAVAVRSLRGDAAGAWLVAAAHLAVLERDAQIGVMQPMAVLPADGGGGARARLLAEQRALLDEWQARHGRDLTWMRIGLTDGAQVDGAAAAASAVRLVDAVSAPAVDIAALAAGRSVVMADGSTRQITLDSGVRLEAQPQLFESLLMVLSSPTVIFVLLMLALMALIGEVVSPTMGLLGGVAVGFTAAALIGIWVMPLNWYALGGLIAAAVLIGLDIVIPSAGLITLGGLSILVVSAMNLFNTQLAPGATVAWWVIVLFVGAVTLLGLGAGWLAWRAHRRQVMTGAEGLIGRTAEVRQALTPSGMVFVDGALWRAICLNGNAPEGAAVEVAAVNGLQLTVRIGAAIRKEHGHGS